MRQLTTIGSLRTLRGLDRQTRLAPLRIGYMGDARLDAAIAMNDALAAHDYNVADQPLYRAYQEAAGLNPDGFPGTTEMSALFSDLAAAGIAHANVEVYPWRSSGGYDGVNAPASAVWYASPPTSAPGFIASADGPAPATPSTPSAQPAHAPPSLPAPLPPFTPVPTPSTPATPSVHPVIVAHPASDSAWPWVLGAAAVAGLSYGIAKWHKKRRHSVHTRRTSRVSIFT